jgi:murein DD-endopeptidase MepM/ murein hydrolase activator NlpD
LLCASALSLPLSTAGSVGAEGQDIAAAGDRSVRPPWSADPHGPGPLGGPFAGFPVPGAGGPPGPGWPFAGGLFGGEPPPGDDPAEPAVVWTRPVAGQYPVSAPYGRPGSWLAGYHTGVDFALPVGVPVHAVGPGTVVVAGYSGAYGNAVLLRMADGHHVLYAHLSAIEVAEEQELYGGEPIGRSGNTGRSTGPHLHFEVRSGRDYGTDVDPLGYLRANGVDIG